MPLLPLSQASLQIRMFRNVLCNFVGCGYRSEVQQNIFDESLFDCLLHRIDVIRLVLHLSRFFGVGIGYAECLQCLGLRGSGKCVKREVAMLALGQQVFHQGVFLFFKLLNLFFFDFCEFFKSFVCIGECGFSLFRVLTALAAVSFIYNYCITFAALTAYFVVDVWETMECAYYDSGIAVTDYVAEF